MLKRFVCVAMVSMLVASCGGDDEEKKPARQPGTTNKQSVINATEATIGAVHGLTGAEAASSGTDSAFRLGVAALQTQGFVLPSTGQTQGQSFEPVAFLGDLLEPHANPPRYTGTCECTETSCTFTACKGSAITIDGTYSWGGGELRATGLKFTLTDPAYGTDIAWTLDAYMSISSTSIDGMFVARGTSNRSIGQNVVTISWDSTITLKDVTLSAGAPQPTGGTLNATGSITGNVGGQDQTWSGSLDVTFPQ